MSKKNVVFMGTPDFAVPILELLIEKTNVVMVVTKPDKPVERKRIITPSPVKRAASLHNIEVFQPEKIRNDFTPLEKIDIDLIVTCAYGQIIPQVILDMPKYGAVNVHASILPKYRGAAPIQWALLNGDKKTGVTIMYMDAGMDTGDIIKIKEIDILESDNVGTLHEKLSLLGRDALDECLDDIFCGKAKRVKQGDNYTLAPMIKRENERLDFTKTGEEIINKIRAFNPFPLANIIIDNEEVKVLDATFERCENTKVGLIVGDKKTLGVMCQDGIIYFQKIKPSGKKELDIKSYLNGKSNSNIIGKYINDEK